MRIIWQSISILIISGIFLGCGTTKVPVTELSDPDNSKNSDAQLHVSEETIDFEGVSFRYDASTFGEVKWETVPAVPLERPDDKPDFAGPAHVLFTFALGREDGKARIAVYSLPEFPKAYSVSPRTVNFFNEEIAGLRKALKNPSFRLDEEIPHLPYRDASDNFYVKVREFDFEGGDGIIFVTHWSHEADLVSNRNLLYRFEGITHDGKFYVTAELPVSVDFLPDNTPSEFEGYTYENLFSFGGDSKTAAKRYKTYLESITSRLEKLQPADFSPNLEKFESVIASLRIDK